MTITHEATISIDCQEFHERAMDYRGASMEHAHGAYERLVACVDARLSAIEPASAPTGYFRQSSSFGPWVECKAGEDGAVALFAEPASAVGIVKQRNTGGSGQCNAIEPIGKEGYSLAEALEPGTLLYLEQPASAGVPEGWKLVLVEPTEEMKDAADHAWQAYDDHGSSRDSAVAAYRSMVAAAPVPPVATVQDEREAFEDWYCREYWDFKESAPSIWNGKEYDHLSVQLAFASWQARAAQSAPVPPSVQPQLTVWYGSMPESNGKLNFTAILNRKDAVGLIKFDGLTIARSEYPNRVLYEADCVRHLIGELAERPDILDYDTDKRSDYVPPPSVQVPDIVPWHTRLGGYPHAQQPGTKREQAIQDELSEHRAFIAQLKGQK